MSCIIYEGPVKLAHTTGVVISCLHAVLKSFFYLLQKYLFLKSTAVLFPH